MTERPRALSGTNALPFPASTYLGWGRLPYFPDPPRRH